MNAGTPPLHPTGQVEKTRWMRIPVLFTKLRDQLTFLKASSKRAYRISNANQAIAILLGDSGSADAAVRAGIGGDPD